MSTFFCSEREVLRIAMLKEVADEIAMVKEVGATLIASSVLRLRLSQNPTCSDPFD